MSKRLFITKYELLHQALSWHGKYLPSSAPKYRKGSHLDCAFVLCVKLEYGNESGEELAFNAQRSHFIQRQACRFSNFLVTKHPSLSRVQIAFSPHYFSPLAIPSFSPS
mgnify:FL=1